MKQGDDCLSVERNQSMSIKCVDTNAICAHSFREKCTAKLYKHLCEAMKKHIDKCKLSEVLGN